MNFGFKIKLKEFKELKNHSGRNTGVTSSGISIISNILIGVAIFFGIIAYVALNTFWIVFIGMIIAEIFGYTHPLFSFFHLSIIGTPVLIILGGIFSFLIALFLMMVINKIESTL